MNNEYKCGRPGQPFQGWDDVKFTDGEALTASDVVFTFNTAKESQSSLDLTFMDKVEAHKGIYRK